MLHPYENIDLTLILSGDEKGKIINHATPFLGLPAVIPSLQQDSALVMIQDTLKNDHVFLLHPLGFLESQSYRSHSMDQLVVYDQGFKGYGVFMQPHLPLYQRQPWDQQLSDSYALSHYLEEALTNHPTLIPPIQIIADSAKKIGQNPSQAIASFVLLWHRQRSWFIPKTVPLSEKQRQLLSAVSWRSLPLSLRRSCLWSSALFEDLTPNLLQESSLKDYLTYKKWPFLQEVVELESTHEQLQLLTQQIASLGSTLARDDENITPSPEEIAHLLSIYMRMYDLHWETLVPPCNPSEKDQRDAMYLAAVDPESPLLKEDFSDYIESPLEFAYEPSPAPLKLEDSRPVLQLKVHHLDRTEDVELAYDPTASSLFTPILSGQFKLRFQAQVVPIPHRVRLHDVQQINYPGSAQAFSYEAKISVQDTDQQNQAPGEPESISMNYVYETLDGYRFYLSSLSPPDESRVQKAQLAVNADPARYILTYPGSAILALGIILLLWGRRWFPKQK